MNKLTTLEHEVLTAILSEAIRAPEKTASILNALVISDRKFSLDVSNKERCVGFYVHFASNRLLADTDPIPHHLSVHLTNHSTPAGGDFILFFDQANRGLDFLEASFFDHALPTDEIVSANHGFTTP
jgi:hypothetical protein